MWFSVVVFLSNSQVMGDVLLQLKVCQTVAELINIMFSSASHMLPGGGVGGSLIMTRYWHFILWAQHEEHTLAASCRMNYGPFRLLVRIKYMAAINTCLQTIWELPPSFFTPLLINLKKYTWWAVYLLAWEPQILTLGEKLIIHIIV